MDRERPSSSEKQKKYYSGKKKRHTFKNQVITTPNGQEIVDVTVGHQ
nr:transposase family protein [Moorena sp. SIO1F2]